MRAVKKEATPAFVPVAVAATALGKTREVVIRRIQSGTIKGKLENGRWLVDRSELAAVDNRAQT